MPLNTLIDILEKDEILVLQEKFSQITGVASIITDDMHKSVIIEMAIINGEIIPYYQPIVRLDSEGSSFLYGYEVLARWNHPQYGILSPGLFIPIAEKHNILDDLSR